MPLGLGVTPQPSHASNVTKRQANEEVAMDKAEGRMKEAYGALVGDEAKAKKAERERDKQEGKGGVLGNTLPKL